MAKASKKAGAKKAAAKGTFTLASVKNNKLTIDLRNVLLTDTEIQKLIKKVQKAAGAGPITSQTKKANRGVAGAVPLKAAADATAVATGATVTATFFNTIPGRSELTATHKGLSKTITQSNAIGFDNVAVNDLIRIKGSSLGRSEIKIDRTANPQQREFPAGGFGFNFTIKD